MDVADEDDEVNFHAILSHFYPTHEEIQRAQKQATLTTICCIHGYVRQVTSSLNVNYDIPNGIIDLCSFIITFRSSAGYYHR